MRHAHGNIVKAKVDDMNLRLLVKRVGEDWIESGIVFPMDDREVSYYLCQPKHLKACLTWLNGSPVSVDGVPIKASNGNPTWFSNAIFMDNNCVIRVVKEHWVLYDTVKKKLYSESVYTAKPKESGHLIAVKLDMPK